MSEYQQSAERCTEIVAAFRRRRSFRRFRQQSAERCTEIVAGKVCRGCGGELKPLETVDNAGRPTFWPGCESCSRFDYGVSPEVFRIARELVEEGTLTPYTYSDMQSYKDSQDENKRRYWLTAQTSGAATAVQRVLKLSGAEAKLAKVRECVKGLNPAAIDALRDDNQQQLDADGVMVGVSRQAADETVAMLDELIALMGNAES